MRVNSLSGALSFALGIAAALVASELWAQRSAVETPGVEQDYLLSASLSQFPGKSVVVFTGSFSPGSATPFHQHPGTELLFVLEGRGEMIRPGRDPIPLKPGVIVLAEPVPGETSFTHLARNLSASDPMKTLVIVIHDSDGPTSVTISP